MKRNWKILVCLLMVLATLSSCASDNNEGPTFSEVTQYLGPAATDSPGDAFYNNADQQSIFASNPYEAEDYPGFTEEDALGEEDYVDDGFYDDGNYDDGGTQDGLTAGDGNFVDGYVDGYVEDSFVEDNTTTDYSYVDPNATVYPFAGSSPIPLDPVDLPSATPQNVEFIFVDYIIPSMGLTFKGPAGWIPEENGSEQYTLSEPAEQMKDGQLGMISIFASPVNENYSESALKSEIQQRLKAIGDTNFEVWDPSLTATRHLMGSKGVYANYSGTMVTGIKLGGRIHAVTIDQVLYRIEIVYPLQYKEAFLEVFSQMRSSLKRQQ